MNKEMILKIAKHCQDLANRKIKPQHNWLGLCREIYKKFDLSIRSYIEFSDYPEFSGDTQYPVKSLFYYIDEDGVVPSLSMSTSVQYYNHFQFRMLNMWDARTKYGKARLHFTKWISEQLFELAEMYG